MMNKSKIIRPKKVIHDIRKQRAFLVQNWVEQSFFFCFFLTFFDSILNFNFKQKQYKFIHQIVLEHFIFGTTQINVFNRDLCSSLISNDSFLENEYQVNLVHLFIIIKSLYKFFFQNILKLNDKNSEFHKESK